MKNIVEKLRSPWAAVALAGAIAAAAGIAISKRRQSEFRRNGSHLDREGRAAKHPV